MRSIVFIFFLTFLLVLRADNYNSPIYINGTKLMVEIAENDMQRAYGLMYRESMPDSCGMLFIFEAEREMGFWMKNTKIPLSIAYIDITGRITDIKDMEPFSLESVRSSGLCLYALEVNRGWFKRNNVKIGDRVEL